jgi:cellulose biosynthesis protein BcsQ
MHVNDVLDVLRVVSDFLKDNAATIGSIAAVLFLGSYFYYLFRYRMIDLEKQLEQHRNANKQLEVECSTYRNAVSAKECELRLLRGNIDQARKAFRGNVWHSPPDLGEAYHSGMRNSIPIIVVANLKGGVGKTTIATNLAAYFEARHGERILAIDLDYQGSMSSMLLADPINRRERTARGVMQLINGRNDTDWVQSESSQIRLSRKDSRIMECDHPFSDFEAAIVWRWVMGDVGSDIRYHLARVLHSPQVQSRFNRVIIDAPPRMTAGFINALCAGTHLLVPTVLDVMSADRVGLFFNELSRMKEKLFPHLDVAGVVGTMKSTKTETLRDSEREAIAEIKRRTENWLGKAGYFLDDALIPRNESIASAAGLRIAYYTNKDIFDPLGKAVFERTPTRQRKPHESQCAKGYIG